MLPINKLGLEHIQVLTLVVPELILERLELILEVKDLIPEVLEMMLEVPCLPLPFLLLFKLLSFL